MASTEGYLVITKTNRIDPDFVTPYKGVWNGVPFDMDAYKAGFDDPLVFGDYQDESGLIPTLSAAREVLELYTELVPREELEIIYVRQSSPGDTASSGSAALEFIGYDVAAAEANFFSLCGDEHFEFGLEGFASVLNKHRLFDAPDEAQNYLTAYLTMGLEGVPPCVPNPVVWEVYIVNAETK